jgi:hypothetical protein
MNRLLIFIASSVCILFSACQSRPDAAEDPYLALTGQYEKVLLTADLSGLSASEKEILPLLIAAAEKIDKIFWLQTFGDSRESLLDAISEESAREYALINYGPWSRLAGHTAFYPEFLDKPLGAQFYPEDMSREEFDNWDDPLKNSPYCMIRRGADGQLKALPYSLAFSRELKEISDLLAKAANLAEYDGLASFLNALSDDILSDDYTKSEYAWMRMKGNNLDLVMRPLDTGEDRKFGYKASYSTYILVRDHAWSARLARYAGLTGAMRERLPVPEAYRHGDAGSSSEINVYDALYYAGHCNAGPKIIALYLPRDQEIQRQTGIRSMQLKNVMEAKYEYILAPIGRMMIHPTQRELVHPDAFFLLTAFHEIAASLGMTNTIDGQGSVRDALREHHNTIDATATDLMALFMIAQLAEMGEITEEAFRQAYVTSFASVMRSSRFGAAGAHGIAGMIRFNFFEREDVFQRCPETLTYEVNVENMKAAVEKALEKLIMIQGDGNYEAAARLISRDGSMPGYFREDIDRINAADIPVDVYFKQGMDHLDL